MNLPELKQTMSSKEIAELTGKNHRDVMRSMRNMEPAWRKVTGRKFALSEYADSTGRKLPMYLLTKKECLYIATKFNDEARARLINRWEELENNLHSIKAVESMIISLMEEHGRKKDKLLKLRKSREELDVLIHEATVEVAYLNQEILRYMEMNSKQKRLH